MQISLLIIKDYIASLDEEGRRILAQELKAAEEAEAALVAEAADLADAQRPTAAQLRSICLYRFIKFVLLMIIFDIPLLITIISRYKASPNDFSRFNI